MDIEHPLKNIIKLRNSGISSGIASVCSANSFVVEAAMEKALESNTYVLIESTSNQVNQYGGYTGMRPADFKNFVDSIAQKVKFPCEKIILGGDHLGPLPWANERADTAMDKAKEMVKQYVLAGFTKIHIDTSMFLGEGIDTGTVDFEVIAERSAELFDIAYRAFQKRKDIEKNSLEPVYVIGSEVPTPGGIQAAEEKFYISAASDFEKTVDAFKHTFIRHGLDRIWENIIAVVVQPGVEFGNDTIREYNHDDTRDLCVALNKYSGMAFEGHSTDYQNRAALKQMVQDGFAILKVGPALTFAMREAMFALNYIEEELLRNKPNTNLSRFIETLEDIMLENPKYWIKHYTGDENSVRLARKFSMSDRCRYYMNDCCVKDSLNILINNLRNSGIPLSLISQFLPVQYKKIREGLIKSDSESLIIDNIKNVIDDYYSAISLC